MENGGCKTLDLVGCEGITSMIEEKINELSGEAFEFWADLNYRLGRNPSLHGAAEHLLYVGRKTQSSAENPSFSEVGFDLTPPGFKYNHTDSSLSLLLCPGSVNLSLDKLASRHRLRGLP